MHFRKSWMISKLFLNQRNVFKKSWDFRIHKWETVWEGNKDTSSSKCFLTPFEMFQIVNQSKLFLKTSKHVHNSDQDSGTENLSQTPKLRAAAPFGCLWSTVLWFKSFLVMQSKDGNIKAADGEWWHCNFIQTQEGSVT